MTDPPSPLWDSIPPNPVGQALSSALKPTKNARLWVVALASVVVAAALVVIALMSVQTRDAEREQACYARVLTLGSNYSEVVGQKTYGVYSLSDSAEQARDICDMKFGRGA